MDAANPIILHQCLQSSKDIANRLAKYQSSSFKFIIKSTGVTLSTKQQVERFEEFRWMPLDGAVSMKSPDVTFMIYDHFGFKDTHIEKNPDDLKRVYFGVLVAQGNRHIVNKFDLKKRVYLGTTSMDAELSLVMANQALATRGSFVLDPFVGTGSFLVSCSHFGAYTIGADIDGRQIRGSEDKNIDANAKQYNLESFILGSVVCDVAHHPWRYNVEIWDAIVCDPPYGVRAGARRLGSNPKTKYFDSPVKPNGELRYPQTVNYEMQDVISDLVQFAATYLVPGGRLVYWLPTMNDEYKPQDIPVHPRMVLISNSEQKFGKWSRRLITMEKNDSPFSLENLSLCDLTSKRMGHTRFRERYFNLEE